MKILEFCNDFGTGETAFDLIITRFAGGSADLMKYVYAGDVTPEEHHRQDGTVYGHANAAGGEAVEATDYLETAAFGRAPAALEPFPSAGGVAILFDRDGRPSPHQPCAASPGWWRPTVSTPRSSFADREDDEDGCGGGKDSMFGGAGNDRLDGGKGENRLIGGLARDTCVRRREQKTCR